MTFEQFCYLLLGIVAGIWAYRQVAKGLFTDFFRPSFEGTIPIARIATVFCLIILWGEAPAITSVFESAIIMACVLGASVGALFPLNARVAYSYVLREHSPQGVINVPGFR